MTVDRPVTFTLDTINLGTAIAPDAALTLPTSVTLRSANPVTTSSSAGVVVWSLGDIAPGDFKTITATVEFDGALMNQVALDAITPVGQLTYTLSVGSAAVDIAPGDNTQQIVKPVEWAAPEHLLADRITTPDRKVEVEAYLTAAKKASEIERQDTARDKPGPLPAAMRSIPGTKNGFRSGWPLRVDDIRRRRDHGGALARPSSA